VGFVRDARNLTRLLAMGAFGAADAPVALRWPGPRTAPHQRHQRVLMLMLEAFTEPLSLAFGRLLPRELGDATLRGSRTFSKAACPTLGAMCY